MAGQTDVLNQLVGQAAAIIYPQGTTQPSICGMPVKIYPGWPVPNVLEVSIGHALVGEALYDGLAVTVRRYLALCRGAASRCGG